MKKLIVSITLAVISVGLLINTLSKESVELKYAIDGTGLYNEDAKTNSDFAYECSEMSARAVEEYRDENPEAAEIKPLEVDQIKKLISIGWKRCVMEGSIVIPANLALVGVETLALHHKAAVPYELAKNALSGSKIKRCSDYIKPLYAACPTLLKPYMTRVEADKKNDDN